MNKRQIALLVTVVVLLHGGLILYFAYGRSLPSKKSVPRPEFVAREARWVDEETGEKLVYREFRVSTRLSEAQNPAEKPAAPAGEALPPPGFSPADPGP